MITLDIHGWGNLNLTSLVLDVNGTLALDGNLIPGVKERITELRNTLDIHMITADTHGRQKYIDEQLGLQSTIIVKGNEAKQKADFVHKLGSNNVVGIGNGANDAHMLKTTALGIAVLGPEGLCRITLQSADLVCASINDALDLLRFPQRLLATLRS